MHRRTYLAMVGAAGTVGLGGCGTIGSRDIRRGTPTSTESPSATGRDPTAEDGGLTAEAGPVAAPDLVWTVEKQSPATAAGPCRLRIAVENTGPTRELSAAGALPFPPTPGVRTDGADGVVRPVVVPVEDDHDHRWNGDCWQAPIDDPDVADEAPWDWGYGEERTRTLAAGDRIGGSYHVLASWTTYCFQRGEYRFERRYELAGRSYVWTFVLQVPTYDRDG